MPARFLLPQRTSGGPGPVPAQQPGHLRRSLNALGRILGLQPFDDANQPGRDLGVELADRGRLVLADAAEHGQRAARAKRRAAGAQGVQHAAQAEQVRAVIDRFAPGLFRGHVLRRADQDAALRQAGMVRGPGQAEIGDLDPLPLTPTPLPRVQGRGEPSVPLSPVLGGEG